jgi:hypothetical protein
LPQEFAFLVAGKIEIACGQRIESERSVAEHQRSGASERKRSARRYYPYICALGVRT